MTDNDLLQSFKSDLLFHFFYADGVKPSFIREKEKWEKGFNEKFSPKYLRKNYEELFHYVENGMDGSNDEIYKVS
jgi:hypothetical protein